MNDTSRKWDEEPHAECYLCSHCLGRCALRAKRALHFASHGYRPKAQRLIRLISTLSARACELGYDDKRDVIIMEWWGEGSTERLAKMADEIIRARPDVIVTGNGSAVEQLLNAGIKIPMVVVVSVDPVVAKLVDSFSRPGGNVTGISLLSLDLMPKRIEYLKEVSPAMKRIAVLGSPDHSGSELELKAARDAAARLGLAARFFALRSDADLDRAFSEIASEGDDAILAFSDPITMRFAGRIAAFSRSPLSCLSSCQQRSSWC